MQGGKNWILPKEIMQTVLLELSLTGNLEKLLMSLYGTEWRERDYGLWGGKTWTEVGVLDELYLAKPAQRG